MILNCHVPKFEMCFIFMISGPTGNVHDLPNQLSMVSSVRNQIQALSGEMNTVQTSVVRRVGEVCSQTLQDWKVFEFSCPLRLFYEPMGNPGNIWDIYFLLAKGRGRFFLDFYGALTPPE